MILKLLRILTGRPREAWIEVRTSTPGLTRLYSGPRKAREEDARREVRRDLRIGDPKYCYPCHYGFALDHARSEGGRGEWPLRVQEYVAALDELRRLGADRCKCPALDQLRQESHAANAPWVERTTARGL